MSIVAKISRTSSVEPPCDGCTRRRFRCGRGYVINPYIRTFADADAFIAWVKSINAQVVVGPFDDSYTCNDGGPLPTWDVEIYDAYRE